MNSKSGIILSSRPTTQLHIVCTRPDIYGNFKIDCCRGTSDKRGIHSSKEYTSYQSLSSFQEMVKAGCHFQERHGWERPGYFVKGENPEVCINFNSIGNVFQQQLFSSRMCPLIWKIFSSLTVKVLGELEVPHLNVSTKFRILAPQLNTRGSLCHLSGIHTRGPEIIQLYE